MTTMTSTNALAVAAGQVERLERAWNDADGAAWGAAFTDDADFVDIRGSHHTGAAAIGQGHQGIFDSIYAGSAVRYSVDTARVIAPGHIVAVVSAVLDAPSGPLRGVNHSRATVLLVNRSGAWRVTAFHNTLVAAGT
jgi:uncharacterized protein (TIGR02246 family)